MSTTFSIALSALQAESDAINIAGNNLANMNTTGFKESTADFKNVFSAQLGAGGQNSVGLGVTLPVSNQLFTQGGIVSSSSATAAAVQGNGYFVVTDPTLQTLYTRDGNFQLNSTGHLVTETGENVQGWSANAAGVVSTNGLPSNILVPTGATLPAVPSTTFTIGVNLDASGVVGSAATGSFTQPVSVIDSLGNSHVLSIVFTKTAANTWNYNVTIPGSDLTSGVTASVLPATPAPPIPMTFSSSGVWSVAVGATQAMNITGLADGASNMTLAWNLSDSTGAPTITQYATASSSSTPTIDGSAAAQLTQVGIQSGGSVVASFTNGQTKVVGQLALASIVNQSSLQNVGNNNFAVTGQSATPALGLPQSGGRGQILGGSLEASNVDMAGQLTNLIVYQSAYQAASRIISTEQTVEQDLFSLIH